MDHTLNFHLEFAKPRTFLFTKIYVYSYLIASVNHYWRCKVTKCEKLMIKIMQFQNTRPSKISISVTFFGDLFLSLRVDTIGKKICHLLNKHLFFQLHISFLKRNQRKKRDTNVEMLCIFLKEYLLDL